MPLFHLSFSYRRPGDVAQTLGNQTVPAETLEDAAQLIARARGLKSILILDRFFGKGDAQTVEPIFRNFLVE